MIPEAIEEGILYTVWPERPYGGQQCGMGSRGIKLIHTELQFEVCCNHARTQLGNRELCYQQFEWFLINVGII